jgi:hypothetical protein
MSKKNKENGDNTSRKRKDPDDEINSTPQNNIQKRKIEEAPTREFIKLSSKVETLDDLINISLPGCRDLDVANIQIIDLNGKFVLNQMVTFTAPNASVSIDVHSLIPGNYILNFQSKGLNINRSIRID